MKEVSFTGTPVDLESVYTMLVTAGVPVVADGTALSPSWPRGGLWSKQPALVATKQGVVVVQRSGGSDAQEFVDAAAREWRAGETARRLDEFKRWLHDNFPSPKDREALLTSILQ